MLEGLEISEINYSAIDQENRYDSEFFQRIYVHCDSLLLSKPHKRINEEFKVTDGEHGSVDYQISGIRYLTAENIKKGYVDISNIRFVSQEVDIRNSRARVKPGDILISIKGTLGEIAIAEEWLPPANMNRDVAILKPLTTDVPSEYVALFLMSKYGSLQSSRGGSGGVQQMITLERLRNFIIPSFSKRFYDLIIRLYRESQNLRILSKEYYLKADTVLSEDIDLDDFKPSSDPVNIKSLNESFLTSGRLDAEYYQKKYEGYLKLIKSYRCGFGLLSTLCRLKDVNYIPIDNKEYKYIELADVGHSGEIRGCTYAKGNELPTRARRIVKLDDVIVSSIEGSLESCALVTADYNNALCSTGFFVLSSEKINSETLLVIFKSEPMQSILKQNCSGTILTSINKNEFQNIPIPLIDSNIQQLIKDMITECFNLRKHSAQLLNIARRAVEIGIEANEIAAIEYINQNII